MIWLLSQLWPIALISLLAGFVVTWLTVVQRRTVTARRRVPPVSRETVAAGPVTSVGSSFEARTDVPRADEVPAEKEPVEEPVDEPIVHESLADERTDVAPAETGPAASKFVDDERGDEFDDERVADEHPDNPYAPREDREPYVDDLDEPVLHEMDDDLVDDEEYLDERFDDEYDDLDVERDVYADDDLDDEPDAYADDDLYDEPHAPDDEYPTGSTRHGATPAPAPKDAKGIGGIGTSVTSRLKGLRRR